MQISVIPLGELGTNCYVVADETSGVCAVIDPGADGARLSAALENLGLTAKAVLLTHGHYDHVGGVRALHEKTGAPVYLHKKDLILPEDMTDGPLFYTDFYAEADAVTVGDLTFLVLETPGHTPGSVCLRCEDALFVGDTLFLGSCGRVDFPGGSWDEMRASLARLSALEFDGTVYPGHGDSTTLDAERRANPYMRQVTAQ